MLKIAKMCLKTIQIFVKLKKIHKKILFNPRLLLLYIVHKKMLTQIEPPVKFEIKKAPRSLA